MNLRLRSAATGLALFIASALAGPFHTSAQPAAAQPAAAQPAAASPAGVNGVRSAGASFIRNCGQWPADVLFGSRAPGVDLWLTRAGILFDLYTLQPAEAGGGTAGGTTSLRSGAMRRTGCIVGLQFIGASNGIAARGIGRLPGAFNYLTGRDSSRWARNVERYSQARTEEIYPGISAVFYYEAGRPRYDLAVAPGADPARIAMRYTGAKSVTAEANGDLVIATRAGNLVQHGLYAYQRIGEKEMPVACSFTVDAKGLVKFTVGSYDRSHQLVIDPLLYSSFVGGSGDDGAYAVAVDASGNAYIAGYAAAWSAPPSDSFPRTVGAYDRTFNGGTVDAFVAKFDCVSDTLVYSTVIGGSNFEDARAIVLDNQNNAYVCGFTGSSDFPTTASAYARTYIGGLSDAFVLRLNQNGSALDFSTYIGGLGADGAYALRLGPGGDIRVAGFTQAADYPVTRGAYDTTFNGAPGDIFVSSLSLNGSTLNSSTYVGGSGNDSPNGMVLDAAGNAYVVGITSSTDFPTTGNAIDKTFNGGASDVVVFKLNPGNTALLYSTYVGGNAEDIGSDIALTSLGAITFCGSTSSHDYPTTPNVFQQAYRGGASDGFVSQIDPTGNTLNFSTMLGGPSDDYAYGLALDASDHPYVCGTTVSDSFPSTNDAYMRTHMQNSSDAFITELSAGGTDLAYSTFIGGGDRDVAYDIAFTGSNVAYITGLTKSLNYPITAHRYSDSLGRTRTGNQEVLSYDAFISKLDLRNVAILSPTRPQLICGGSTVPIQWSSPRLHSVNIQLSHDGGATYPSTLQTGLDGATGGWNWIVPGSLAPGSNYRIRVIDAGDTTVYGESAILIAPAQPTFTTQPQARVLCRGEAFQLTAEATGTSLHYQWLQGGAPIQGATRTTYDGIANDTASYSLQATDTCGTVVRSAIVTVTFHPGPVVTGTPQSTSACTGASQTFTVATSGVAATYQWRFNGTPIPGATGASYTIPSVKQSDAGSYTVAIAYAPCESKPLVTAPAVLTVGSITIASGPDDQHVQLGQAASFSVSASGSSGLSYQWRRNGQAIPGATSSTYSIGAAAVADTGTYDVVITGPCTAISTGARLLIQGVGGVESQGAAFTGVRMTVTPNPVSGTAAVHIQEAGRLHGMPGARLELTDALGRTVNDLTPMLRAGSNTVTFNTDGLPDGVYYCRVRCRDWNGIVVPVVVAR
ncbi:MAG TPA: SBBP repeat-containing protein [Candidatus Kapabacteria bacterium]|nr:SBBP repeat-containing protein [Candidatus Kapabacteria bacterium]